MTERRAIKKSEPKVEAEESFLAPLHIRWRPKKLAHVYGQNDVVDSLKSAVAAKNRQHTFFFIGPPGTGKTSLARIMADEFKCSPDNIISVDAASTSGIDDMRVLTAGARYSGFGESPNKAYIIDECQALSKNAWDSLLMSTEEPPAHVFFFFCSTNPSKIPAAMLTRGPNYVLQSLRYDDLMDLLEDVCKADDLPTPPDVLGIVARACSGSPRQALVMLAMVQDCKTAEEAEPLLQGVGETKEVIDLCRAMVSGRLSWQQVQTALKPLADLGAEGIRIQVTLYLAAVLMSTKGKQGVARLLDMLNAFSKPCNPTDKLAPIMLAFGMFVDLGDR